MDNNSLYKKTEQYVTGLFHANKKDVLVFHNLQHTRNVVQRTKEIAGHYHLSEEEMLILYIAAWFHDTGHLFAEPSKHEEMSVELMRNFMLEQKADAPLIEEIGNCIFATKLPRNPTTLLQEIICDADTYHLGTKDFKNTNKLAYEEIVMRNGEMSKPLFNKQTYEFLEGHQFYTAYCKDILDETKQENMKKLKNKMGKEEIEKPHESHGVPEDKNLASKGIQTMLRLTSSNHLKLSEIADHKANILITVNSIIISVILSVLLRKLQDKGNEYLAIPTIIFLLVAVSTIVISILATRPKVSGGTFTEQDLKDKKINLLFFGNFHKTTLDIYANAMRTMMNDPEYLYNSMVKDIFYLGVVLGWKYKLLRLAYNVFMIGIICSVLAFAFAVYYNDSTVVAGVTNATGSPL